MIRNRNFLARLLNTTCFGDPGAGDGGAGGGGSAPSAPSGGNDSGGGASPAPSSEPTRVGPSDPPAFPHSFPQPKVDLEQATRVRGILDLEKDPNHTLSQDQINDLLGFNPPFQAPEAPKDPTPPNAQVEPPKPATPAQPATPAEPQLSAGEKAIIEAIKAQQPAQPQQPQQPQQPGQPPRPKLYYGEHKPAMQVPEQVAAALFNTENPQQAVQALNYVVNGMMNQVMQDVAADNLQMVKAIMNTIPNMVQVGHRTMTSTDRFYNSYPELQKDALRPVVKTLSEALVAQRGKAGLPIWDESFNTTLGEAVHSYIEQQLGVKLMRGNAKAAPVLADVRPQPQVPAAPQQPPANNGVHGQPWMTPGGSRPPAGPGARDQSAAMFDLIM